MKRLIVIWRLYWVWRADWRKGHNIKGVGCLSRKRKTDEDKREASIEEKEKKKLGTDNHWHI